MNFKNKIPLLVFLISSAGLAYHFLPSVMSGPDTLQYLFISYYAGAVLGCFLYWLGIRITLSSVQKEDVEMKIYKSYYFLPLILCTLNGMLYTYCFFPLIDGNTILVQIMFVSGLVFYSIFYIIGMIIVSRDINDEALYFRGDQFAIALMYVLPSLVICPITLIFVKDSSAGAFATTAASVAVSTVFFYFGIKGPASENEDKSNIYVYLILLAFLIFNAFTLLLTPVFFNLFLGKFLYMYIGFISILLNFIAIFCIGVMLSGKIYEE